MSEAIAPARSPLTTGVVLRLLSLGALVLSVARVEAHIQVLRGRLVDAVQQSDVVVIATVTQSVPFSARLNQTTANVEHVLRGQPGVSTMIFRGPTGLVTGQRYTLFLRRAPEGLVSVAPSGTVFPAGPADDGVYRRAVESIQQALDTEAAGRVTALRGALIPLVSAGPKQLRYYAALELVALNHGEHQLSSAERGALERCLSDPTTDPSLRPVLTGLLQPTTSH